METKQINLKLPANLIAASESYARNFGYRNLQELAAECLREKIFQENKFDESFSEGEIELIDGLIGSFAKKNLVSEEELSKVLLG